MECLFLFRRWRGERESEEREEESMWQREERGKCWLWDLQQLWCMGHSRREERQGKNQSPDGNHSNNGVRAFPERDVCITGGGWGHICFLSTRRYPREHKALPRLHPKWQTSSRFVTLCCIANSYGHSWQWQWWELAKWHKHKHYSYISKMFSIWLMTEGHSC